MKFLKARIFSWDAECAQAWADLPVEERERYYDEAHGSTCDASRADLSQGASNSSYSDAVVYL